jgi:hypothetical protein
MLKRKAESSSLAINAFKILPKIEFLELITSAIMFFKFNQKQKPT